MPGWITAPPIDLQGADASELVSPYNVAPPGAITINTTSNLVVLTAAAPAGTTFWLAPGTHDLPGGEFAQVTAKSGNRYVGAPGAIIDGGGINRYCFSGNADDVTIEYLEITGFICPNDEGVVNHNQGDRWLISRCNIHDNGGGALMGGDQQVVEFCLLKDNGQYGINWFKIGDGMTDAVVRYCEITGNNQDNLEFTGANPGEGDTTGCGCSGGMKFWAVEGAHIHHNYVHDNLSTGIWADTNDLDFLVEDNWISGNFGVGFFYEISYNAVVRRNVFRDNAVGLGTWRFANSAGLDYFPDGAIYLSEAGGDSRVGDPDFEGAGLIVIEDNYFRDNWDGVVLWENSDRFSTSPANTSTGYCTPLLTLPYDCDECADNGLLEAGDDTYYDLCRWRTQNVRVRGNWFRHDADETGHSDGARQAIIANYGTFPAWSPYDATVVQQAITFEQGNTFEDNVYEGDWQFQAFETTSPANNLDFSLWQTGVVQGQLFEQDEGSALSAIGLSMPEPEAESDEPPINWQPVGGGFTLAPGPGAGATPTLAIQAGLRLVPETVVVASPEIELLPEPLTDVTAVCQPWIDQARLAGCAGTASASIRQQAAAAASDILYVLSGRQWPGVCEETVQPCTPLYGGRWAHQHLEGTSTWVAVAGCSCGLWDDCGCGGVSYVQLRRDAIEVSEVTVDGETVDTFRLLRGGRLVSTDGAWPCCQDLTAEPGTEGTFTVTYTFGKEPPIAAAAAAEILACELAKAATDQDCALPERVTSVTRQGVSFAVLDPQDFLVEGRTGLYQVDLFLSAYNPAGLRQRSSVWWPGKARLVRE